MVAGRHQKPGPKKVGSRADQGLQVVVGLADGMPYEADLGGIAADPPEVLVTRALPRAIVSATSLLRSKPCTRWHSALHASASCAVAGRTT